MRRALARLLVRFAKRLLARERGPAEQIGPPWLAAAYVKTHVLAEMTTLAVNARDAEHDVRRERLLTLAQELVDGLAGANVREILRDCLRPPAARTDR